MHPSDHGIALELGIMLAASLLADRLVRPRGWRSLAGYGLQILLLLALACAMLALSGSVIVTVLISVGLATALVLISNTKMAVLGEPLLFSDLVLVGAVFRHPQFYLLALKRWQLAALVLGGIGLLALMAWRFVPDPLPHLIGLAGLALALLLLRISLALPPWRRLAPRPDALADVAAHGLTATVLLHWQRWRSTADPAAPPAIAAGSTTAELVVVVQCESFADPVELFADQGLALPGLAAARQAATLHGRLLVSGFGAYTMRTEYGVLFGRDEDALGFRRFDPYLTATREAGHALPARLTPAGWHSLFLHPHDLRFYARDRILAAAGFAELVGPEAFAPPAVGRYVSDAAIADMIMARAQAARGPSLIHAVTIENHGPWPADRAGAHGRQSSAYLALVARGDAMLARLMAGIAALRRPAVLLFYGDHRPSIPGAVTPGGDRHTPYVLLRFDADGAIVPGNQRDLTPAQLHHALLAAIMA
jgi:hypothetical protein